MDIDELSKKIDEYHKKDVKRAERDNQVNLGWIAIGFTLAMFSNYLSTNKSFHLWFALIFAVIGLLLLTLNIQKKK
jgi:hypothetical protein